MIFKTNTQKDWLLSSEISTMQISKPCFPIATNMWIFQREVWTCWTHTRCIPGIQPPPWILRSHLRWSQHRACLSDAPDQLTGALTGKCLGRQQPLTAPLTWRSTQHQLLVSSASASYGWLQWYVQCWEPETIAGYQFRGSILRSAHLYYNYVTTLCKACSNSKDPPSAPHKCCLLLPLPVGHTTTLLSFATNCPRFMK